MTLRRVLHGGLLRQLLDEPVQSAYLRELPVDRFRELKRSSVLATAKRFNFL